MDPMLLLVVGGMLGLVLGVLLAVRSINIVIRNDPYDNNTSSGMGCMPLVFLGLLVLVALVLSYS
jgi:uncharacterized membrane protein YidH (DUF202 family)